MAEDMPHVGRAGTGGRGRGSAHGRQSSPYDPPAETPPCRKMHAHMLYAVCVLLLWHGFPA